MWRSLCRGHWSPASERAYTRLANGPGLAMFGGMTPAAAAAAASAPVAIHAWSTDAVPPPQRLDYWIGAV